MKSLYQTVEDRENPMEIESRGPFLCKRNNAWLGEGFYFWDTFMDLAHWWGMTVYDGKYVICKSFCDASMKDVYDLYDDFNILQEFVVLKNTLQSRLHRTEISVNEVLCFLKKNSDFSKRYKAIRAKATGCIRNAPYVKFVSYNKAYLELMPPVQFCVLDTTFLYKKMYQIVYPVRYVSVKNESEKLLR